MPPYPWIEIENIYIIFSFVHIELCNKLGSLAVSVFHQTMHLLLFGGHCCAAIYCNPF